MAKDHGKTLTRLFITSAWGMSSGLIKTAVNEFSGNGWCEEGRTASGYRCLTMFDADMNAVRRAAKKNPGLIFFCFTLSGETESVVLHLGIGGSWLTKTPRFLEAVGIGKGLCPRDYVHTMGKRPESKTRKSRQKGHVAAKNPRTQRSRRARTAAKAIAVSNRLVFHGLPDEVERCRMDALEMLPVATQAGVKYETAGSETYASGTLEFTTAAEPAFRVFNRLVAQVPGVTVSLEYDDLKTGQRRLLRAIDGRVIEHKVISPSTGPRENRQRKQGKGR